MKRCTKCDQEKSFDSFQKDKYKKDGLYPRCKDCVTSRPKQKWVGYSNLSEERKSKKKVNDAKYRLIHAEKEKERHQIYYQSNKRKYYDAVKKRKESNPLLKMSYNIRSRIYNAMLRIRVGKKSRTNELIGCSFEECKTHIENKFLDGMSWDNYGLYTWHIDHIIPLSSAKNEEELLRLFHYTNLQPLWAKDNLIKYNKNEV